MRNGSERVVTSSREHIYDLRSLENYTFTDENGKDQGINVRHKVNIEKKNCLHIFNAIQTNVKHCLFSLIN